MVRRAYWLDRIERLWERRSIVWLYGVRRCGKTFLCQSIDGAEYFDCELPGARAEMAQVERFLDSTSGKRLVLDEVHKLPNPSELLKVAADHYPQTRIIATGSSTLQASSKFRDTLTGRRLTLWLTPIIDLELPAFGDTDLAGRLVRGGLPPFFLQQDSDDFRGWIDSFWARDLLELFRLERRDGFQKLTEMLFVDSGGIFEATRYAGPCEINRQTVNNYRRVLESMLVIHTVKPFSSRGASEIVSAPKVYSFDTGFVSFYRGFRSLSTDSRGSLWEHYVLNEMNSVLQGIPVQYWRDKQGHEVDFVLKQRGGPPVAVECKWSYESFDPRALKSFRNRYPGGLNLVVATDVSRPFERDIRGLAVKFVNLSALRDEICTMQL